MDANEFRASVRVLPKQEATRLRRDYISKFINTTKEYWKEYWRESVGIAISDERFDDVSYSGYLWDSLKDPVVVDCDFVRALVDRLGNVFVFWDLHNDERVPAQTRQNFALDDVLSLNYSFLMDNLQYLPEDIYIFDESFQWTVILTHEYENDKRWCLKSGEIS